MTEIKIDRSKIPLWFGANGGIVLQVDADGNTIISPGSNPILDARFSVEDGSKISLGDSGHIHLGVKADAHARLTPIFKEKQADYKDLVNRFTLSPMLSDQNLLLVLELGGDATLSASGSYRYTVLNATASLEMGADAGYAAVRSFPRSEKLLPMVTGLLQGLSLPDHLTRPPAAGELLSLEYGGYLNLKAGVSAGYELKGTKSFRMSEIALAEHYALSIVGKLSLTGQVAGRFSINVMAGADPGWARVVVRRQRSRELQCAADVKVAADLKTDGLPATGKEFLGALLGVQGKNWLNTIDGFVTEAGKVDDIDALKAKLDGLASDFITAWSGKAIDTLLTQDVLALQAKIKRVVDSYRNLDKSAIALFDRYFDPALNRVEELASKLNELQAMTSWDQLKGEIDPTLWNVVRQLTDGDPLGWALGLIPGTQAPSLKELQKRVEDTLDLIKSGAHEEIRNLIRVAKENFPLDHFLNQLGSVTTPEGLKAVASRKLGHFVSRLIGSSLDKLNGKELKRAFEIVQKVVNARDSFFNTFDTVLKEAASQSYAMNLHAAYSSANEQAAMIDVEIRLQEADGSQNATGARFMAAAGSGDFQEVLANYQPSVVKLHEGLLTHKVSSGTLLKFNIAGWHRNLSYEEMHRVIVNTEQQIRQSGNGILTVITTVDMKAESETRRNGKSKTEETVLTNFLLRFLADTKITDSNFDAKTRLYALEVITRMVASYGITFTDMDTSPQELEEYLLFARQLGLDQVGATPAALAPMLELRNGSYGSIKSSYDVRYTEDGIRKLIEMQPGKNVVRNILRRIVLANYFGHPWLSNVAWLYCSDDVRKLYDKNPIGFTDTESYLGGATVTLISPIEGIHPPSRFDNNPLIRNVSATLFQIEDTLTEAFNSLGSLLGSTKQIKAADLETKLNAFGKGLQLFDKFDMGENSIFAVFDGLILLSTPDRQARRSSLKFVSTQDGIDRTKVFSL
jgi:hypothetical protein